VVSLEEEIARALAVAHFDFSREPDEEWNERQNFKVPILYYKALARVAIKKMRELRELPDEVETVARAMWHDEAMRYADVPLEEWEKVEGSNREDWLRQARAALNAVLEARQELEEESEQLRGEINDVLSILASRGYEVNKNRSLVRNLRPYLKTPKEMGDGKAEG
jgi:uncharacterized protein (UPF0335 family)